ncbi:hypothetical protein [Kutzneria buriramensis]|uniref:Uncharacterized protein n=1 Tax=Kutzneria buriramensis TaxID=1045776 RepID=A0A3E0G5N1_9PSEU|nr:hypothetical protein [Kutzneria buriramensis]REH18249.1 hypothetical protein BCF44_1364 [Kutzneria buriramensis]
MTGSTGAPWWEADEHIRLTSDNVAEVVAWLEERLPAGARVVAGEPIEGVATNVGVTGLPPGPEGWRRCWNGDYFAISRESGQLYTRPPMFDELSA